jgi:hypothetical protein
MAIMLAIIAAAIPAFVAGQIHGVVRGLIVGVAAYLGFALVAFYYSRVPGAFERTALPAMFGHEGARRRIILMRLIAPSVVGWGLVVLWR